MQHPPPLPPSPNNMHLGFSALLNFKESAEGAQKLFEIYLFSIKVKLIRYGKGKFVKTTHEKTFLISLRHIFRHPFVSFYKELVLSE